MAMTPEIVVLLNMVLVAALWGGSMAQSSSCTNVIISMSPCLNYITGNSTTVTTAPSSSCCTQLASVVRSQPQCLCQVLTGSAASSLGINVNQTQALALPNACNVQTPPVSQCNASSPADSPAGTPSSPSGSASKTVPSTGGDTSDGNTTKLEFSLLLFLLFMASCALTFTPI